MVKCACDRENDEAQVLQLLEAGLDFDKEQFEKSVNCLILRYGLERCLVNIFFPFLEKIGLLWLTDHVIPGQEHFVSHIIRKKIILATDGLERGSDKSRPPVVIFAPKGEHHEIPLLTVNYFFRRNGHRTVYFGPDLGAETLHLYLKEHPAALIYTHVIALVNNNLEEQMEKLCAAYPEKQFVISGPAGTSMENPPLNLRVIRSINEAVDLASQREFI